jgi:hypothetical protein
MGQAAPTFHKEYLMQIKTVAIALALAAAGLAGGQAFAQDHVTIQRDTPNGVVTKHIVRREDGSVRRVVVHRPDGSTVIRRTGQGYGYGQGYGEHHWRNREDVRMHRTVVIHRHDVAPRHVVIREGYRHRPDTIVNRRVTVIHNAG